MLKLQVKCMDNFIIPKTKTTQNTNNRIFLKGINRGPVNQASFGGRALTDHLIIHYSEIKRYFDITLLKKEG